jgi:hypothetical protein
MASTVAIRFLGIESVRVPANVSPSGGHAATSLSGDGVRPSFYAAGGSARGPFSVPRQRGGL